MVKQSIQIFVRLKPTKGRCGLYDIDVDSDSSSTLLTFIVPRDLSGGIINNKKEHYKFRFQRSFNQDSKQEEVFECVSKPVIDNVLQGYNGTVFAYGQTGSGKTFTITGGAERYADRGIIPRTLSHIFEKFEKTPELLYTLHISYLEIYNENGYDLLDPKHDAAKLEDLPKVILLEDSDQNIHLKNLTIHQANNEEEALNLLFLGDTNRMIAETPMNQASTRSHCIFTIHITSRETGSAIIRRSKLHLVDLAGSERVAKSGMNGILLTEAKYINLSLHYLEQVIVALSEKNRQHVPYRNSMMTSVLRDSLGGNCMTSMIATCSVDRRNIDESISSCRFAQRVALIKNEAVLNEELDPKLMIHRLKREVHQLREELALRTGEERTDNLSEEEKESCLQSVKNFLDDNDSDATLMVKGDMRKIQECFRIFKKHVLEKQSLQFEVPRRNEGNENETEKNLDVCLYSDKEVTKLKDILQQRDNEINILVNMLKKEKKRTAEVAAKQDFQNVRSASASNSRNISEIEQSISRDSAREDSWSHQGKQFPLIEKTKSKIFSNMSLGRQQAFKIFRRDYEHNQTIENNKQVLKQRYAEAKELGQRVNQSRTTINQFKGQIERHRLQLLLQGLVDSDDSMPDQVEQNLRKKIEREKLEYKEYFNRLRILKTEIEHLQHLMEKAKMKLLKDFELWWAEQAVATQRGQPSPDQLESQVVSAWRTPLLTPLNKRTAVNHFSDPFTADERDHSLSFTSVGSGGVVTGILSGFQTTKNETTVTEVCAVDTSHSNLTLTGDPKADADILAFVKARQNLLQQNPMGRR